MAPCALSWSPDGKRLATGHGHSKREKGAQNEVRIWSPDGKLVKSYPAEDVVQGRKSYRLHRLFFRGDNEVLLLGNKAGQRLVLALNLQSSGAVREVGPASRLSWVGPDRGFLGGRPTRRHRAGTG